LNHNQITNIHTKALSGLKLLTNLQIDNNSLTIIDEELFSGLDSLVTLTLNENNIERLTASMFTGLNQLRSLHIRGNRIVDLPSNVFTHLPALQIILLLNNQITTINNLHFSTNHNLTDIRLNGNNITSIHPEAFNNLKNINFIRLSQNRCTNRNFNSLNGSLAEVLPNLETCFNNYPRKALVCKFKNFYSYTCLIENMELDLIDLVTIYGSHDFNFTSSEVFSVVVQSSKLSYLPDELFTEFPNLSLVKVDSSELRILRPLKNCDQLSYFLVPNNQIAQVDHDTFSECKNLSVIDLSKNKIIAIGSTFIDELSNLSHLYLSENECIDQNFVLSNETVKETLETCFTNFEQ
jgi:Leucine-rich repeat (LRR) protein